MKHHLARLVNSLAMLSGWSLHRAHQLGLPRILMYHAIGAHDVSAEVFAWQLQLLTREFEVLSLPSLMQRFDSKQCTGDEIAITFDDGVRNHISTAYPLLCAAGTPATFFVCPGLIDSGQWIWNMELRARLQVLNESVRLQLARQLNWPVHDTEGVVAWAKTLHLAHRKNVEQAVRNTTLQFEPSAQQLDLFAPMSWEQVHSLDPLLITIGSHTVNHPVLTTLESSEQAFEISQSRRQLEVALQGRTVDIFCYPNGGNDASVKKLVRQNYLWAVTTQEDGLRSGVDVCGLPRVPAAGSKGLFLKRLHKPSA
jgi:peptidoglycan/xylan/chitin deacetylase (PgdA/CDA1 family)